ncbi:hypothetical protein LLG46_04810 [bacterium]|nr:hypothetical protein [bacterium]
MRTYIWLALLAIVVSFVIIAFVTVDRSADEAQIRSMVSDTVSSINKRDLGGTIGCVSRDYKDSTDMTYERLRILVAQALRVETDYHASAKVKSVSIEGDKAEVELHFTVTAIKDGSPMYERDLTLHMAKENSKHAWIIPVKVWRVIAVDGLALESEIKY